MFICVISVVDKQNQSHAVASSGKRETAQQRMCSELSLHTLTGGWGSQVDRSMRVDTHSGEVTQKMGAVSRMTVELLTSGSCQQDSMK